MKPTKDFWEFAGVALMFLCGFGGIALVITAGSCHENKEAIVSNQSE